MSHQKGQGGRKTTIKAHEHQINKGHLIECSKCKILRTRMVEDCPVCKFNELGQVTKGAMGRFHR